MLHANFGPKVAEYLGDKCGGVQVLVEQYLDFVLNRMFREPLLVHAERAPLIRYNPDRSRYRRLHIAAWVPPVDGQTRLDHSRQEYQEPDDATLFTNDPGIKAALDALCRHCWTAAAIAMHCSTPCWPFTVRTRFRSSAMASRCLARPRCATPSPSTSTRCRSTWRR